MGPHSVLEQHTRPLHDEMVGSQTVQECVVKHVAVRPGKEGAASAQVEAGRVGKEPM